LTGHRRKSYSECFEKVKHFASGFGAFTFAGNLPMRDRAGLLRTGGAPILVTGGAGFIGTALVCRLVNELGLAAVNADLLTYGSNPELPGLLNGAAPYAFEHIDICDGAELRRIFAQHRPSAVMHLAGETHVDRSIADPSIFLRTNTQGTFVLLEESRRYWTTLESARRQSFHVVLVSTDEVFGSIEAGAVFSEESPYRPNSPYAASKAAANHFGRAAHRTYGLPVTITYCTNNYGPYQFHDKFIPTVIHRALAGTSIPIYGDGLQVREWLFVDDHVDALLRVLDAGEPGEEYMIGSGVRYRNVDLAIELCRIVDDLCPVPGNRRENLIEFVIDRPGHDRGYGVDTRKIQRDLGWVAKEPPGAGLRRTVEWYVRRQMSGTPPCAAAATRHMACASDAG
jgi:dTDP-glucose 4,6-dehydratase